MSKSFCSCSNTLAALKASVQAIAVAASVAAQDDHARASVAPVRVLAAINLPQKRAAGRSYTAADGKWQRWRSAESSAARAAQRTNTAAASTTSVRYRDFPSRSRFSSSVDSLMAF